MNHTTTNQAIIDFVENIISNLDPTPIIVNDQFPLRWESNIFLEDYDFVENFLNLDKEYETLNGAYLKSVATAIVINKEEDGSYEFWDGIFMIESHTWCSKLNSNQGYPSFSFLNQKFNNLNELTAFLIETYQ